MHDHTWILDVLSDIKAYAEINELPVLSQSMQLSQAVAISEIVLKLDDINFEAVTGSNTETGNLSSARPAFRVVLDSSAL